MHIRVLFVIWSLLMSAGMQAAQRTKDDMKAAAMNVLMKNSASRAAALGTHTPQLKEYLVKEGFSVIGHDDLGFAVVTSDDRFNAVIGYSSSTFSDTMPDGFKWWMEKAEDALSISITNAQSTKRKVQAQAPLLTTKWAQEYPFNAQLRYQIGGDVYQFLTGCVATAMAQVMNYHRFPRHAHGSVRYVLWNYQTWMSHTFGTAYDWEVMQDSYSPYQQEGGLDEASKAVSVLMRDCGMAVKMNYDYMVSLANTDDVVSALTEYFSYDETGTKQLRRSDYSRETWMQMIYDELNEGRPIIYSGINRSDPDKTYGHTFVVHGYDTDGLVCINWGWRGQYDGYFDIDMLNANGNSFNDDQDMIFVKPGAHERCALRVVAGSGGKVHIGDETQAASDTTKVYMVDEGEPVTVTAVPDEGWRIKYVFVGQNEVTAEVKDGQYTFDRIDDNMTVSVMFEKIPIQYYALRIRAIGDGSVVMDSADVRNTTSSFSIEEGRTVTMAVTPDEGWKVGRLTVNGVEIPAEMGSGSYTIADMQTAVTIVIEFVRQSYQLTYMLDGELYRSYELLYNDLITAVPAPTKVGYSFTGWSETPSLMPAHDVTVVGSFAVNTYQVTYIIDGEVYQTDSLTYMAEVHPPVIPGRTGYDFEWEDYPATMPASDLTVTGCFLTNAIGEAVAGRGRDAERRYKIAKGVYIIKTKRGTIKVAKRQ